MHRLLPYRHPLRHLPLLARSYSYAASKMSACASSPGAGPSSSTSSRTQIKLPDMSDMQTLDRSRFDTKVPSLGVVVEPRDVKRFKMHPTVRQCVP